MAVRRSLAVMLSARGGALLEALVACVVLSAAGLAAARLQLPLHLGVDATRQGAEAMQAVQSDIEHWGVEAGVAASSSAPGGGDVLASGNATLPSASGGNADYRLTRTVVADASAATRHKTVTEQVDWTDRSGRPQRLVLDTIITSADPMLTGALWLARTAPPLLPQNGRAPGIPTSARPLGDGTSLIDLGASGAPVLRVDDRDGSILATCPPDTRSTGDVTRADLSACVSAHGLLVSGHVRFDGSAAGTPRGVDVRLALTAGGDPASPPVCASNPDASGSAVDYRCAVYTTAEHIGWSGRSILIPIGWVLGTAFGQRKVCRYSRDDDGSGAIDRNAEHPADYTGVTTALTQQNFVVVPGDSACPVDAVQHQP